MKLEINEVNFLMEALKSVSIKASDAPGVANVIDKLEKEFVRLQKIEAAK